MSLEFVDCDEGRVEALRTFFRQAYGPSYRLATDEALLHWQFGGLERRDGGLNVKLAVEGKTVKACLGYVPVDLTVAGETWRAAWTANWMVDQALRRLGLGPLLLKQLMAQHDVVLSVGLDAEAAAILPRLGWTDFGNLRRHVCILDREAAARLGRSGPCDGDHTRSDGRREHQVLTPKPHEARVWAGVDHGAAGTRRSAGFLSWRYAEHPVFSYEVFAAPEAAGRADGLAIYRIEQVRDLPVRVGRIVELIGTAAADELLAGIVAHARAADVAVLDFFYAGRQLDGALARAGFVADAGTIPLVFQPIDWRRTGIRFMAYLSKVAAAEQAAEWYVTKGDGDQDRPN